jgi:DNA-binding MarR family transcriptional regulator
MESTPADLPDAVRAFRSLLLMSQQMRYLFDRRLEADDLTTSQAMALTVVELSSNPPSYSDVATVIASSHQNVAKLIEGLERKGFVTVKPDDADRRVRRIRATERSRRYWARRDRGDFEFVDSFYSSLSERDLEVFVELLGRIQAEVEAQYWAARHPEVGSPT